MFRIGLRKRRKQRLRHSGKLSKTNGIFIVIKAIQIGSRGNDQIGKVHKRLLSVRACGRSKGYLFTSAIINDII